MQGFMKVIWYSYYSGITVFLGGLLSLIFERRFKNEQLKQEVVHTSIAFGGGIIVAAVAFVLVPKGMSEMALFPVIVLFLGGAGCFFFLDRAIERKGGSYAQVLAMLMDFIPEAIALGAVFATDHSLGLLLALFIGLQNLPEAFNSYRDLRNSGWGIRKCLVTLFFLSFTGVIAAVIGDLVLQDMPAVTSSLMLFSSGGILYLIFQDIAPMSKLPRSWFPALGVDLGFLVGMIGQRLLG